MNHNRLLSDVAIDSALLVGASISAAAGLPYIPPILFAGMVGLSAARRLMGRERYTPILRLSGVPIEKIDQSDMGRQWIDYLDLKAIAAREKQANVVGTLKRVWMMYGLWLGAIAYWTMPFIIAFAGPLLAGQYVIVLMLVGLHHLSIFAQFAEIRAWARKRNRRVRNSPT